MPKYDVTHLEAEIRRAHDLTREGNCSEAYDRLEAVRRALSGSDVESAFVCWLSAVAADGLGLLTEASTSIDRACAADPVCPMFQNSRRIIRRRLEAAAAPDLSVPTRGTWN